MIYKLIIFCIGIGVLLVWIKNYCPDYFPPALIASSAIVLTLISNFLIDFFSFFNEISSSYGVSEEILSVILKVLFVSYLTEFAVGILEDMQLKSFSDKVLLGGKLIVLTIIFPIIKQIVQLLSNLL